MSTTPPDKGGRRGVRIGRFEVIRHIATGGMGAVYRAFDPDHQREVALKVISSEVAARQNVLERFAREAQAAQKLQHENIVQVYEWGEATGTYYLVMEFVNGIDLYNYIGKKGKLKVEEARQLMMQAARALEHANEQGIIHRDIKPANFLLTQKDGQLWLKLTDLGLALQVNEDLFRLTTEGTTVGTVDYMAPEQARDSSKADIRSDIYSLGCTLFHMLAGQPPFPEGGLTERIWKHVESPPPDICTLNPAVSPAFRNVLQRMLAKKPTERFQTPAELLTALENPEQVQPFREEARKKPPPATPARAEGARRPPATQKILLPKGETEAGTPATRPVSSGSTQATKTRQEEDTRRRSARKKIEEEPTSTIPGWLPWAAGGAAVLAVLAGLFLFSGSEPASNHNDTGKTLVQRPTTRATTPAPRPTNRATEPIPVVQTGKGTEPEKPIQEKVPRLLPSYRPPEPAQLRQEFEGPHLESGFAAESTTLRVQRAATEETYPTLADALAAVANSKPDSHTVIEIDDRGPHFVPTLPPLQNRHLTIRAARGCRPLLAWDLGAGPAKEPTRRWLAIEKGSLALENLDLVVRWQELLPSGAGALLEVQGGNLSVTGCTFSFSGRHGPGVSALRLVTHETRTQCHIRNCYFRGSDLTAVTVRGSNAHLLLCDTLAITTGQQPLLRLVSGGEGSIVRLVRSSLCTGKSVLQVQPQPGLEGAGLVECLCCDDLLAQYDPAGDGSMLHCDNLPTSRVSWRAVNTLYTGWRRLLLASDRVVAGTSLPTWHAEWRYNEGDRVQTEHWPANFQPRVEEVSAELASTLSSRVHYQALSRPGPLGCDVPLVPAGEPWLKITYERPVVTPVALPTPGEPLIPVGEKEKDQYHGERLQMVPGLDLGKYLEARVAEKRDGAGPRVVLRLSGSGEFPTSPIVHRHGDLIIHCDRPPRGEPLTLVPQQKTAAGKAALFEVEHGNLELHHVRLTLATAQSTAFTPMPQRAVKVRAGRLTLLNCTLKGPLVSTPDFYRSLIEVEGPGQDLDHPAEAVIVQSVLLSGRNVLLLRGTGIRCRLKGSLALATNDLLGLDLGACGPRLALHCQLENNTLALRRSLVCIRSLGDTPVSDPLLIQSENNLIVDPFSEGPRESALLRAEGKQLGRGLLLWQGRGNGFDRKHLRGYIAGNLTQLGPVQPLETWLKLWGSAGEQQARPFDLAKWSFKIRDLPLPQLALPFAVRATLGPNPPGANLEALGIGTKKK